jgi:NAD(P)-dependent dehydrogenase (short-subunit alcohol dehydrogenase family)
MAYENHPTTDDVLAGVDLHGTTAVVTGASSGIGAETARALAAAGAHVDLAVRDVAKGKAAADGTGDVEVGHLDLTSLASVRAYARDLLDRHDRVNLLINNAGVMATPFERTVDGFELQFGTNHLGHFLLTALLAPVIVAAAPARIVNVTSAGHQASDIDWDDPNYQHRPYDKWESYGQSKTANILFSVELERRLGPRGVHAYAVHPGMIATELGRHLDAGDFTTLADRARTQGRELPAFKPVEKGAATTVWAATAPELEGQGGTYLEDCRVSEAHAPWALDPASAERLWSLSEELVGEKFAT